MNELQEHAKKFLRSAELVYSAKDYTSATTLYFKSLFVALDAELLKITKKIPKDHTERFQQLKLHLHSDYELLDRYFIVYRSTYTAIIDKETCEEIRTYVRKTVAQYCGS